MSVPPAATDVNPLAVAPAATAPADGEHALFDHIDRYLLIGQESTASDIHLGVNMPPLWRRSATRSPSSARLPG